MNQELNLQHLLGGIAGIIFAYTMHILIHLQGVL